MSATLTVAALFAMAAQCAPGVQKKCGVAYLVTNTMNGKKYVGITVQKPTRRWNAHKRSAANGDGQLLHRAIAAHGLENFTFEVVASARSVADLLALEAILIAQHNSRSANGFGYNLTAGGLGILDPGPETRELLRLAKLGTKQRPEHRDAIAAALRGKSKSEEHRLAAAAAMRVGIPARKSSGRPGRTISAEARAKIAASIKSNPACSGWKHSDAAKAKMSAAKKGTKPAPHAVETAKRASTGRKHTPEERERMRLGQARRRAMLAAQRASS
jgi:group I intron endonuclease